MLRLEVLPSNPARCLDLVRKGSIDVSCWLSKPQSNRTSDASGAVQRSGQLILSVARPVSRISATCSSIRSAGTLSSPTCLATNRC